MRLHIVHKQTQNKVSRRHHTLVRLSSDQAAQMKEEYTLLSLARMAEGGCHQWCLERFYRVGLKEFTCWVGEEGKNIPVSRTSLYRQKSSFLLRGKSKYFCVAKVQWILRKDTGNLSSDQGRDCYLLCVHVNVCVCVSVSVCVCMCMLSLFSHVQLFATPWSVALQTPLSVGFSRQEYWSGLPCPPPGDLPDSGIEPMSLMPPALAGGVFTTNTTWEALAPRKLRVYKL